MAFEHTSVMPEEVQKYLQLKPGHICVDCTLGGSGHAKQSIKAISPTGKFIGIDQDNDAIKNAKLIFKNYSQKIFLVHDNFSNLPTILESLEIKKADGILLDLGLSLNQLKNSKRGFSFQKDEVLDMRMDTREQVTAMEIVNSFNEKDLADIFYRYGEERMSRKIAKNIVKERTVNPIKTSSELAQIVKKSIPAKISFKKRIHPATKVFQALRIYVNKELERLETFMKNIPELLNNNGRLVVISFHSLEDRIVKQQIKKFENGCTCPRELPRCACGFKQTLKSVFKKPLIPSLEEINLNPMARSAKMRVAQRV
ncbi:MAG: 16S rRNA (cytosine(1402)-N(4))-methyltransferase RsmH [Desulfobacteraceae bacterium]|nr:16S rRNA (cytosine(1402)-N(4))-methyltransferase RsmH [Desulfobacteraceae bacterium]